MFAAASGARLAHRHNKTAKKQNGANQFEGFQVHTKGYQRHQQLKYADIQNRYSGIPQRRLAYSYKLYSSNYNPGFKLSTSYIDINGRISKLGEYDFEGKAAWQDREFSQELDRRESICVPSEVHCSSKIRQKEAHRRWVRKNRIQDLSLGDQNSDEDELVYGVQNGAANLLLYVGLGTMCVGMIIAFVGTGEKGFKTMELRLIGPSLIGAGVLIIILRILLCVCPSKCLQLKKQKHKLKNSTNKLNSEGNRGSRSFSTSGEQIDGGTVLEKPSKRYDGKKRVSIAMLPTTSGLSTNFPPSSHSFKPLKPPLTYQDNANQISAPAISFFENEKPTSSKSWCRKSSKHHLTSGEEDKTEGTAEIKFELKELRTNDLDAVSYESQSSCGRKFSNLPESLVTLDTSDLSITSVVNGYPVPTPPETKTDKIRTSSKFETARSPKNLANSELVLSPSTLNECNETD